MRCIEEDDPDAGGDDPDARGDKPNAPEEGGAQAEDH